MKVLIVKMSALGDVVQSLPVAMAIRSQYPEAKIDWLVEKPSYGLLAGHPALDRVLVSPRHEIAKYKSKLFQSVGGFIPQLRARRYQAVLDLQGLMKSAIFVALSRGEQKIGFAGGKEPLAAWPLSLRLPAYDRDRPALERYLDLLEPLGVMRPAKPDFGLLPTGQELEKAGKLLWPEPTHWVVLHPVAKWESKLWPLEHWVALAKELLREGYRLVLTGSAGDRELTEAIRQKAGGGGEVINLAGRTSLRGLAALLSQRPVVVCTDTGVMHLASAMGAKVAALFGPTAPWRTGPYGSGHKVLRLGLECSPCFRRECPDPRCLTELEPGKVFEAVMELWRERE